MKHDVRAGDFDFAVTEDLVRIARIRTEWQDDVDDPEKAIRALKGRGVQADVFSFWQRVPDTTPRFDYAMEWDNWAVLEVSTYEHWLRKQINQGARSAVNKSRKKGVDVRVVPLDDGFIQGVVDIHAETPIRQGRAFEGFGKSPQALMDRFSRETHRTDLIGAYCGSELVGYIQQVYGGDCAHPFGGLTKLAHRNKAINNALLAKAVELCAEKRVRYVVYGRFDYGSGPDTLAQFKRHNGFRKIALPRYFVPLNARGALGLRLGLHHGAKSLVPLTMRRQLKALRKTWYSLRAPAFR